MCRLKFVERNDWNIRGHFRLWAPLISVALVMSKIRRVIRIDRSWNGPCRFSTAVAWWTWRSRLYACHINSGIIPTDRMLPSCNNNLNIYIILVYKILINDRSVVALSRSLPLHPGPGYPTSSRRKFRCMNDCWRRACSVGWCCLGRYRRGAILLHGGWGLDESRGSTPLPYKNWTSAFRVLQNLNNRGTHGKSIVVRAAWEMRELCFQPDVTEHNTGAKYIVIIFATAIAAFSVSAKFPSSRGRNNLQNIMTKYWMPATKLVLV